MHLTVSKQQNDCECRFWYAYKKGAGYGHVATRPDSKLRKMETETNFMIYICGYVYFIKIC